MRDASQTNPTMVAIPIPSDSIICQSGGVSVTIRTSIVIGAENGNIEPQNASEEFGLRMTASDDQRLMANTAKTGIAS